MRSSTRQYIFAAIFIGVGVFQAIKGDQIEFWFYIMAGACFIMNALSIEPRLVAYRKGLVIASWILIAATAVFFVYLLQFKF
ncbi:MAG TPA: hypothetical protein VIL31_15470 [Cyclobacteriaceae bacterium]|jgi:hypothetical protein